MSKKSLFDGDGLLPVQSVERRKKSRVSPEKRSTDERFEKRCRGCICDVFEELQQGTFVRIAFLEDFMVDDDNNEILFRFMCFDKKSCCVTLIDTNDNNNAVIVKCEALFAVEVLLEAP